MFWKFNILTSSKIDSLLEKEDITLKELMEEDDILQECKSQNKKLVEFLTKKESMEELMNLIVKEPIDDEDEKVRYKYPNIACELLTSDVNMINDSLADNPELLNQLYAFLEIESPLNPLLASFFSKVMGLLITRKPDVFVTFLKERGEKTLVPQILHHLSTSAIMDLLLRIVTCIESPILRLSMLEWLNDQHLVRKLVGLISVEVDEERQYNSAQALSDIVRLSREQMSQLQDKADPDPLLSSIESQDTVEDLLAHIIKAGDREPAVSNNATTADQVASPNNNSGNQQGTIESAVESTAATTTTTTPSTTTSSTSNDGNNRRRNQDQAVVNGISVILALLEFKKPTQDNSEQLTQLDAERLAHGVSNVLLALQPRLKEVLDLLRLDPPPSSPAGLDLYQATSACNQRPSKALGQARLSIVKLFKSLIDTNTYTINATLAQIRTLEVLMELLQQHPHNNFLHTQVEQCITSVLNNAHTTENGEACHPLLDQLFENGFLLRWILRMWEDSEESEKVKSEGDGEGEPKRIPQGQRKGYMGHIIRLSSQIVACLEKGQNKERMEAAYETLDEELKTRWVEFVTNSLNPSLKEQNDELGGPLGQLASSSEDEDPEFPIPFNEESALTQAFYDYQMQQMTSTFIDQFGFTADQFTGDDEKPDAPFEKLNRVNLDIQSSKVGIDANDDDDDDDERRPQSDPAYLFEQMCNERIGPYGVDGDSDEEDAWEEKEIIFAATTSQRTSGKSPGSGSSSNGDTMNNNKQNGNKRKKLGPPLRMKLEDLERGMGIPSVGSSDEDEMEDDDDDDDDSEEELPDSPQVIRQTDDGSTQSTNARLRHDDDDDEYEDDDEMWDKLSAARLKGLSNGDANSDIPVVAPAEEVAEPWTADFDAFGTSPSAKPMETDSWTPDFSDAPFEATPPPTSSSASVDATKAAPPAVPSEAWLSNTSTSLSSSATESTPKSNDGGWADFMSVAPGKPITSAVAASKAVPSPLMKAAQASSTMEPPLPVFDLATETLPSDTPPDLRNALVSAPSTFATDGPTNGPS